MSSHYEPKCSLCTRVARLNKIVQPGRKREKIRTAKAYTRHTQKHVSGSVMKRVEHLRRRAKTKNSRHRSNRFLRRVSGRWRECWKRTEEASHRTRRLNALRDQSKAIVEAHAKCGACEILFGNAHTFRAYANGLCRWCYYRRRE